MRQLRASSPNPFLFTRHIRPPPPEVASYLRSRGAGMFVAAWASVSAPPPPPPRTRSSVCSLPPERAGAGAGSGRCAATIPQWTFSPRLARCQPHWYRCEADRGQARSSSTLHTGTAAAGPRRTSSATSGNVVSSASRRGRRPRRGWRSRRPRTRPCSPWPRPPAASWRGTVCWPGGWCWARSGSEVTAPRCGRSPAGGPAPPRPPGRATRRSSAA